MSKNAVSLKTKDGCSCSCSWVYVLGGFAAAFLSYGLNHSVGWAILHFFTSWIYLIYALILRFKEVVSLFQ